MAKFLALVDMRRIINIEHIVFIRREMINGYDMTNGYDLLLTITNDDVIRVYSGNAGATAQIEELINGAPPSRLRAINL